MVVPPAIEATALRIISIRFCVPTTVSLPASPPARSSLPFIPKIVGEFKIMPSSIAFLYQLTEKCGTDGGLMENLPEIDTCGSLSFGSDQEKLNLLLMAWMALETVVLAVFIAFEILFLIEEKMLDTVVLATLKPLEIPLFTASTAPDTVVLIPSQTEDTLDLMPSITEEMVVFIVFQAEFTPLFIPSTIGVIRALMAFQEVERNCDIPSITEEMAELMPFHAADIAAPIAESAPMTVVPMRSHITPKKSTIPFHMAEKTSFTPFQAVSQFPEKIPANTSKSPTSTSSTVPRTEEISSKANSNTGARSAQKFSHTVRSTSVMFSKSKPKELSLSVMASPKASNFAFIPSHMAVTLFLNSSLFFQRVTNAAASTAIVATTPNPTDP